MFIIENLGNTENYQEDNQWFYSKKKKKSTVLLYFLPDFPGAVLRSWDHII